MSLKSSFKCSKSIFCFSLGLLILTNSVVFKAGDPKIVQGTVRDSEGGIPADADLTFEAYITIRSGEKLYKTSLGCGYSGGNWWVQCGNFPTAWSQGETLKIDFTDVGGPGGTETGSDQGVLDASNPQIFGETSLPVQMSSVTAISSQEGCIVLIWQTESEVNNAGFHVWRSEIEDSEYTRITTALIPGRGNASTAHEYTFIDRNVENGVIYWYKIEAVSTDGSSEFYGPITVQGVSPIPEEFGLSQNYPNPFNPETTLRYQLPENSKVSIRIYDLFGREVKNLVHEQQQAGYHTITWQGLDDYGKVVSSGIYFVRMQTGNFQKVCKITLTR